MRSHNRRVTLAAVNRPVPRAISRLPQAPGASRQRVAAREAAGFEACGWPGQLLVRVAVRGGGCGDGRWCAAARAAARPRAAG
jgi:hypothetical protein